MKRQLGTAFLAVIAVTVLTALALPSLAAEESAEETAAYSIFYSPPERVDGLFDAILECYPQMELEDIRTSHDYREAITINVEKLRALEGSFGDMPEYWEARWHFERNRLSRTQDEQEVTSHERNRILNSYLQKAVELAEGHPAHCYRAIINHRPESEEEALNFEEWAAEMLEEVIVENPNEASYRYTRGEYLWKIGEIEEAVAEFEAGNQTERWSGADRLFPYAYAVTMSQELRRKLDEVAPGEALRVARILADWPLPNYIKRKDMFKEALVAFNMSGDLEMLNVFHKYACRMGMKPWAPLIERLVAQVLVGVLARGLLESRVYGELAPQEALGFYSLGKEIGVVHGALRAQINNRRREIIERYGFVPGGLPSTETWNAEMLVGYAKYLLEVTRAEFEVSPTMKSTFEKMLDFDYTNPAAFAYWPHGKVPE